MKKLISILILSIGLSCLLLTVASPLNAQPTNDAEANKALLLSWFDVEAGRYYDRIGEFFTEDLVRHSSATNAAMPDVKIANRDSYVKFWRGNVAMFPDYYVRPLILSAEGDYVAFYATFTGTFSKNGNHISIPMVGFAHFDRGLIDELWVEWDNLTWNSQMMETPVEVKEVPLSSMNDLVGIWRVYGNGWAGYLEVTPEGKEHYFEPGCQGDFCTDTTQATIEGNQLLETGSSVYPSCDARYEVFVIIQGEKRIGLRFSSIGTDCYRERADAYSHIVYFVEP